MRYACALRAGPVREVGRVEVESSGTGALDGCEPTCGCWKFNWALLQEQQALLTTSEPTLQLQIFNATYFFLKDYFPKC